MILTTTAIITVVVVGGGERDGFETIFQNFLFPF